MDKFERIPRLGDIRFIPANDQQPRVYNTFPFDRGLMEQQILSFQYNEQYQQKRNDDDLITVYIDTLATNLILYVYDDSGELLETVDYLGTFEANLAGNTAPNGDPYFTYRKLIKPEIITPMPVDVTQRVYYYVLECVYGDEIDNRYYVSEPIYVRQAYNVATPTGMRQCGGWDDTLMIECTANENTQDVLFEEIPNTVIRQRVEGFVLPDEMIMNDTAFIDQQYRSRTLQSVPNNTFRFTADGIPDYLRDKLNRMLSLPAIRIDGTRYTKREGAKWETEKEQSSMISTTSIVLEEYEDGNTYPGSTAVVLMALEVDEDDEIIYPFAFNYLAMNDAFVTIPLSAAKVFDDNTELDAYLTLLNSTVIAAAGLTGTLARSGAAIVYNNGTGEAYGPPPAADNMFYMYKHLNHVIRLGVSSGLGQFKYRVNTSAGGTAHLVTDWGDNTVEWSLIFDITLVDVSHEYTQNGVTLQRTLRIFHRGSTYDFDSGIETFVFVPPVAQPSVLSVVSGDNIEIPNTLTQYAIVDNNLVGTANIDMSFLKYAKDTLRILTIQNCSVGGGNFFLPSLLNYGVLFSGMQIVNVTQNIMSVAQLDNTIISVYNNTSLITPALPKILSFQGQTPPAPPSDPTALTYISNWLGVGFTVNTD
jgi:hypothetical protein